MSVFLSGRRCGAIVLALLCMASVVPRVAAAGQVTMAASVDPKSAKPGDTVTLKIDLTVGEGFHAQSHTPKDENYLPLTVVLDANPAVTVGTIDYPPGKDEEYAALGTLNVYTGTVTVKVPVTIKPGAAGPLKLTGKVRYQACDDNVCYPPQKPPFEVTVTVAGGPATAPATQAAGPTTAPAATSTPPVAGSPADTTSTNTAAPAGPPPDVTAFGLNLAGASTVTVLGVAFLIGIVFNAVPCVLPVIPLKIGGFYEAAQHSRSRCFLLGAAFSAGLVASFAVLAILVVGVRALSWGQQFQNPIFTAVIVVVLVAMAASQFGLFDINLPIGAYGFTPSHDTYSGNVLFGVLTAALSTPCTIGPFAGLLAWALAAPAALGAIAIIVVGCGMAAPYLVLSAFPQVIRRFPRTGPVGEIIKQTLAFLVLGTAFYFARPFLSHIPESAFWWTLFAFIPVAGIYMVIKMAKAVGTARSVGIAAVLAILVTLPSAVLAGRLASKPYEWLPFSDTALAQAAASGQPVVIDFTADWCGNCHWLEANVLKDQAIVDAVKSGKILMLKADVTRDDAPAKPLLDKLSPAGAIPLTAVYLAGQPEPKLLSGIYHTGDLLPLLRNVRPDA